ncbi:hypothetical protein ACFYO2_46470 [Streptomyces sp. NPDC006602]|uniref:hypothetical protein n=1 Tax=Streptomyces sp. NPDC006602 TaxID=3364751 RepID=UPI003692F181
MVNALDAGFDGTGVAPQLDARVTDCFQQQVNPLCGKVRVGCGERVRCRQTDLRLWGVKESVKQLQDPGGLWADGFALGRLAEREDQVEAGRRIGLRLPALHKCWQYEFTGAVTATKYVGCVPPDLRGGIGKQVEHVRQNLLPCPLPAGIQKPLGDLPGLGGQPRHQFEHHATTREQCVRARCQSYQKGQRGRGR